MQKFEKLPEEGDTGRRSETRKLHLGEKYHKKGTKRERER